MPAISTRVRVREVKSFSVCKMDDSEICQKMERKKRKCFLMFWLIIDHTRIPPSPLLQLLHKAHTLFSSEADSGTPPSPARYWCHTIHHLLLRVNEGMNSPTGVSSGSSLDTFPALCRLCSVPGEVSIKQPECLGHFNPSTTSFISAPTPLEHKSGRVHLWIKLSLSSFCVLQNRD